MHTLIAESGSTKTDWVLIDNAGIVAQCVTSGINPYHQSASQIEEVVSKVDIDFGEAEINVEFYGAGCSTPDNQGLVKAAIQNVLPTRSINVNHDLLAACRSVANGSECMVTILGTGSNTCVFDGQEVVENRKALGYVLGDEGGGSNIGKGIVLAYVHGELADEIHEDFISTYNIDVGQILDKVYKDPDPNRFLASFAPFASKHISNPEVHKIVEQSMIQLFKNYILKYPQSSSLPLNAVGSIAVVFEPILRKVAQEQGVTIGTLIAKPIDGLVKYHLQKM